MELNKFRSKFHLALLFSAPIFIGGISCQKTGTIPNVSGVASFTVVNAIPNSTNGIIPVVNTSQPIMYFNYVQPLSYFGTPDQGTFSGLQFQEYSPLAGNDTVYVVQSSDTFNVGTKTASRLFYGILPLERSGIYSLFLCGSDTSAPDYLLTKDSLPFYSTPDSVMSIRFVNLSTGSSPISINLEGSQNGSEVGSLSYKGITSFKQYMSNSITQDYLFVIRDAASGDSLTQFDFVDNGSYNNGHGLTDITNNHYNSSLTFKNITIALIGQPGPNAVVPQSTMLIDNY